MGFGKRLLDLFFPPKCAFCRIILTGGEASVCAPCREQLPFCQEKAATQGGEGYTLAVSPLYYEGLVRDSIHRYKFEGLRSYCRPYGAFLAPCITQHCHGRYDLISWVPVSAKRLRKRGYDQAKILAQETARLLDREAIALLKKVKHAPPQSALGGREERQKNISGAYKVLRPDLVANQRILLIDDVLTTGATLSESAQCLLEAGAKEVICATLARGLDREGV